MHLANDFRSVVRDELPWLRSLGESAYAVRPDGTLGFANGAFLDFIDDSRELMEPWLDGERSILDACSQPLRPFYDDLYAQAWSEDAGVLEHDYACPSGDEFRWFGMRLVRRDDALLVLHHRLRSAPAPARADEPPSTRRYRNELGLVVQCSHCRMTQRSDGTDWDFVPEWVEQPPVETSHGLCPVCFAHHYPAHAKSWYEKKRNGH